MSKRAAHEGNAADALACLQGPNFGDDAAVAQVCHPGAYHLDCVQGFASQSQYATLQQHPMGFPKKAPFSSTNATSSSVSAFTVAYFAQQICVTDAWNSANIEVAAWPVARAYLSACSTSASAAPG